MQGAVDILDYLMTGALDNEAFHVLGEESFLQEPYQEPEDYMPRMKGLVPTEEK